MMIFLCLVSGCTSMNSSSDPKTETIVTPITMKEITANLGDSMIVEQQGFHTDAIILGSGNGLYSTITPDKYCRIKDNEYASSNEKAIILKNIYGSLVGYSGSVFYNKDNNEVCIYKYGSCYSEKEISIKYEPSTVCSYSRTSFKKTIEFNGKSGHILNFTYREFERDLTKPTISSDFSINENEGKSILYKGASIKIKSATNTSITYLIERGFN